MRFQLGGYELETNFLVPDEAMGAEDSLLGRTFLMAYQVLEDLTSMKKVMRAPAEPVWYHTKTQVGNPNLAVPAAQDQFLVLQPFERMVVRATVVTNNLEPLMFQNEVLTLPLRTRVSNMFSF